MIDLGRVSLDEAIAEARRLRDLRLNRLRSRHRWLRRLWRGDEISSREWQQAEPTIEELELYAAYDRNVSDWSPIYDARMSGYAFGATAEAHYRLSITQVIDHLCKLGNQHDDPRLWYQKRIDAMRTGS